MSVVRDDDRYRSAVSEAVAESVADARAAISRPGRLPRGPLNRWRGVSVERAYQSLHAAKVQLVDLLPLEEVDALRPAVAARLAACLPPTDTRRTEFENSRPPASAAIVPRPRRR